MDDLRGSRMPVRVGLGLGLVCLLFVGVQPAQAQVPDEFTNLKVLPKDIGKRQLVNVMRAYAGALGVRCNYCHVGESEESLDGYDFASDDKEAKRTALAMMQMVQTINDKLLPATGREALLEVKCVTCHHGIERPETLRDLMLAAVEEDGVDQAIVLYRQLREEHYGSGVYDFGPSALNGVAETLARGTTEFDAAIAVMQLNLEFNADASYSHFLLGQIEAQSGDPAAGLASMQKAAELEPDNAWYRQAIERMKGQ